MVRSREADVGHPDGQDGKLVIDRFETFVKDCHNGKMVRTILFAILM